jgi:hypothetical protein
MDCRERGLRAFLVLITLGATTCAIPAPLESRHEGAVDRVCAADADCATDACHVGRCVAGLCRIDAKVCNAPPAIADPLAPCRAGAATFSAHLGGACGGTSCDPVTGCDYRTVEIACPPPETLSTPAPAYRLPQTQPYMVALRNFLATLSAADFTVTLPDWDTTRAGVQAWRFDNAYYSGPSAKERLFEYFIAAEGYGREVPTTAGLRLPPEGFALDQIENVALNGVRMRVGRGGMFEPADTAWWASWQNPGNPYLVGGNARAARLRAFVGAAVDLMMRDRSPGSAMYHLAVPMSYYAYAYEVAKGDLDACTQAAFEVGLRRWLTRLEGRAYSTVNGNNDMGTPLFAGLVHGARATADPDFKVRAIALAKKVLNSVVRSPAGYFEHCTSGDPGRSYDPSYEGITLRYMSWAAAASRDDPDWAFLRNMVRQQAKLKVFMTLPEPDGATIGPSHFANATSAPAALDQWEGKGREYGLALLGGDATTLAFAKRKRSTPLGYYEGFPTEARMRTLLATSNTYMNNNGIAEGVFYPKFALVKPWPSVAWSGLYWTEGLSGAHFYRDGFYAELEALVAQDAAVTKLPFHRTGDLFETFTDEFLIAKLGDELGVVIHTGPVAKEWAGVNPDVYTAGFGGGALSAYWTPQSGASLLGWARGMQAPSAETWARTSEWATHTIWGRTATGAFSAARILNPTRTLTIDAAARTARAVVSGKIQRASTHFAAQTGALLSPIDYRRTFEIVSAGSQRGVVVTTELSGDGKNVVTSLVETLPLFIQENRRQASNAGSPLVTFIREDGATESFAPTDTLDHATPNVVAVKYRRFSGATWIVFEDPQSVRLSPKVTSTDYQWSPRSRTLQIDLRAGGAAPLTSERIRYRIGPAACVTTADCAIGTCIEGVCIPPQPPPPPPPPPTIP